MITKMTKYSFVLLSAQTPEFMAKLQELGMVDINRQEKAVDGDSRLLSEQIDKYGKCVGQMKNVANQARAKAKEAKQEVPAQPAYTGTAAQLCDAFTALQAQGDSLKAEIASLNDQLNAARPWGDFTTEDIQRLEAMGMTLHAYIVPEKKMDPQWALTYPLQEIAREEGRVYFVTLQAPGTPYEFPVAETTFPALSRTALTATLAQKEAQRQECLQKAEGLSFNWPMLSDQAAALNADLDRYLAQTSGEKEAEGYLHLLTGFVPSDQAKELDAFLEQENIYTISQEAKVDDNPPIKLKNNKFARLFEPIGDLYMLPTYDELDLTPYFAPFYMLFFGLCLGDMGYGMLLVIAGLLGKKFAPKMKGYLNLVVCLGIGSILMASLSGVFFGTKVNEIIPAVKQQNVIFMLTDMNMFWFAILFGLFQIVFARIMHGINMCIRKGWQHGMASFGWAILIVWCTVAYASTTMPALAMPKTLSMVLLIGSVLMIIFFSKPQGPIYKRFGPGLWAMYDVTGVFGDMLSYIRLFGLGTAGGILGMVMNQIALSLSGLPYVGWFFTLVVLLIGHSLVLGLSVLGAFVHPLRLTFVEFYKNSGFIGGGRSFRPLTSSKTNHQ